MQVVEALLTSLVGHSSDRAVAGLVTRKLGEMCCAENSSHCGRYKFG